MRAHHRVLRPAAPQHHLAGQGGRRGARRPRRLGQGLLRVLRAGRTCEYCDLLRPNTIWQDKVAAAERAGHGG